MGDLLLPFGEAPDGRLIAARDAARGLMCECVCPQCRAPLVARQGERNRHHFAHHVQGVCVGARETMLHRYAKQALFEERRLWLPALIAEESYRREEVRQAEWFAAADVALETRVGDLVPDLVLRDPAGATVHVEIWVAHRVGPEKIRRLGELGLNTVEIDLERQTRWMDPDEIRYAVVEGAARYWLFHCDLAPAIERMRAVRQVVEERDAARYRRARVSTTIQVALDELRTDDAVRAAAEHANIATGALMGRDDLNDVITTAIWQWNRLHPSVDRHRAPVRPPVASVPGARRTVDIPVEALLAVARMRPPHGDGPRPMPSAFCAICKGTDFKGDGKRWWCAGCLPRGLSEEEAAA